MQTNRMSACKHSWLGLGLFILSGVIYAEVVFDNSVGNPTTPNTLIGDMFIPETRGNQVGSNLFHSFNTFNINTGESATFTGPASIANIIGRVTGASSSNIDGQFTSTITGADVWLINPNGILFGPNASLNVDGSFHASTADYIGLADGGRFGADLSDPANTVLTVANPTTFGFLDSTPAPLSIQQSQLEVPEGEALSIVGGMIDVTGGPDGFLFAQSGQVNIVSVASVGEATLGSSGINTDIFSQYGDIAITQGGFVSVSEFAGFNGAGSIFIRGGNFTLDNSTIVSSTFDGDSGVLDISVSGNFTVMGDSGVSSVTNGPGLSPDINISVAGDLVVRENSKIESSTTGSGDSGDISITAGNLEIADSQVYSVAAASGDAGDLIVDASDTISISGSSDFTVGLASTSNSFLEEGHSGDISLTTQSLLMNGGTINTETLLFSLGDSGDIQINVANLELGREALVSSSTRGLGNGGDLVINASNEITLSGPFTSLQSSAGAVGHAGNIFVSTPNLLLQDFAFIDSSTNGDGVGGDIVVNVKRLTLSSSQITSDSEFASGHAGNVFITASSSIMLINELNSTFTRPRITSSTFGSGDAGEIKISAPKLTIDNGSIDTDTLIDSGAAGEIDMDVGRLSLQNGGVISSGSGLIATGAAGDIIIDARESITIHGQANEIPSGITASTDGLGSAGDITVAAPEISINDFGNIASVTQSSGIAGGIFVTTDSLSLKDGGRILASTAGSGRGGSINVNANSISITGTDREGLPSGLTTSALDVGDGGVINVDGDRIVMGSGGRITSRSVGTGNAGSVFIVAEDSLQMFDDSTVETNSELSSGGNIDVQAGDLVYLQNSTISASANGVTPGDDGGNVTIDPIFIVLNSSGISASANAGNGGNITLSADFFLKDNNSVLDATSQTGIDGEVLINSPNQDVTAAVAILDASFLDGMGLLRQRCSVATAHERSSFSIMSRVGLPRAPDGYFPSAKQTADGLRKSSMDNSERGESIAQLYQDELYPRMARIDFMCN